MSGAQLSFDDHPAIVLDSGSGTCRAGLAGDETPSSLFPSIVGRRKFLLESIDEAYVGTDAQQRRELLHLSYPIEHGIVVNWEDMEKIWDHTFFSDLKLSPEEHPILTSEPPLNPKGNREKMAQVLFETYKAPAIFMAYQPVLSLLASFQYQGIVVSVGDGVSYVVPLCESETQLHSVRRVDLGGRDLTLQLQQLLYKRGYSFTSSCELDIVRDMKEKLCFVARDRSHFKKLSTPMASKCEGSYKLPDGSVIKLDHERYMCPEMIFQPEDDSQEFKGLSGLIEDSINSLDISCRKDMYMCVIVSGGTTFLPGFTERLQKELLCASPPGVHHVKLCARPERGHYEWLGGSIMASLSTYQQVFISKKEYEEVGPSLVSRKHFY